MTNQMLSFKIYKQKHLMLIHHSKTECLSICHLQQRTNRNRFYHGSDMCQIANIGFFFRPWAVFDGRVALESLEIHARKGQMQDLLLGRDEVGSLKKVVCGGRDGLCFA